MATNTLLQSLNDSANQATTGSSNRRQVETFIASSAIAANDLVALDIGTSNDSDKALYIIKADSTTGAGVVAIGFALDAAASPGDLVRVTIAGVHESANVDTTVLGDRLKVSSTAGRAGVYGAGDTVPVLGYAVEADTANVATVIVIKQI